MNEDTGSNCIVKSTVYISAYDLYFHYCHDCHTFHEVSTYLYVNAYCAQNFVWLHVAYEDKSWKALPTIESRVLFLFRISRVICW